MAQQLRKIRNSKSQKQSVQNIYIILIWLLPEDRYS
jgi:hypothetical protein